MSITINDILGRRTIVNGAGSFVEAPVVGSLLYHPLQSSFRAHGTISSDQSFTSNDVSHDTPWQNGMKSDSHRFQENCQQNSTAETTLMVNGNWSSSTPSISTGTTQLSYHDESYQHENSNRTNLKRDLMNSEYYLSHPMSTVSSWSDHALKTPSSSSSSSISGLSNKVERHVVDHTYRDFSGIKPSNEERQRYEQKKKLYIKRRQDEKNTADPPLAEHSSVKKKGCGNKGAKKGNDFSDCMGTNFPARLHGLLSHEDDISDIISWLPHGRSWVVWDKEKFIERVASLSFQLSKFESFSRQVNGWGFKRITQGPDANSYYHELFLKGMPHLVRWMKRSPSSSSCGQTKRLRACPDNEPNFYEITSKYPIPDYYNENGGEHTFASMPFNSGTMPATVVHQKMHPRRIGGLRRMGGLNNCYNVPQQGRVRGHPSMGHHDHTTMRTNDSISKDHRDLWDSSGPSRRQVSHLKTAPSKRTKLYSSCEMLTRGQHQRVQQHEGCEQNQSLHGEDISRSRTSKAAESSLHVIHDETHEILSHEDWQYFCGALSSYLEDDEESLQVPNNKLEGSDSDDDDNDSFCRMIIESIEFET